jgi:hypothetical protein
VPANSTITSPAQQIRIDHLLTHYPGAYRGLTNTLPMCHHYL